MLKHVPRDNEIEAGWCQTHGRQAIGHDVSGDDPLLPYRAFRHIRDDFKTGRIVIRHDIEETASTAAEIEKPPAELVTPDQTCQCVEARTRRRATRTIRMDSCVDAGVLRRRELRGGEQESALPATDDPAMRRLDPASQEIWHRITPVTGEGCPIALFERLPVTHRASSHGPHQPTALLVTRARLPKRVDRANRPERLSRNQRLTLRL